MYNYIMVNIKSLESDLLFVLYCLVLDREKPGDEEFIKLDEMKIPFLLNYAQCKLCLDDFYPVIEHTTEVLKKQPGTQV